MYQVVERKTQTIGRFDVVLDQIEKDGKQAPYSFVKMHPSVTILPFVGDDQILVLKEYRHAIGKWMYEFPSGMIEESESIEEAAVRELKEETGYEARKVVFLGKTYPSFGSTTEEVYCFAIQCGVRQDTQKDLLEAISMQLVSEKELEQWMQNGTFQHGAGQIAWLQYQLLKKEQ